MVKRGLRKRPQASEGEAQHGPILPDWTYRSRTRASALWIKLAGSYAKRRWRASLKALTVCQSASCDNDDLAVTVDSNADAEIVEATTTAIAARTALLGITLAPQ